MNTINYSFTLNLNATQSQISIPVTLGDTARTWLISFRDGSKPYPISDGCLAKLEIMRPTGTYLEEFCAIEKNDRIRYSFSQNPNTAAVEGFHECSVVLFDEEGHIIASPRFSMIVSGRVINRDNIKLSDEQKTVIDAVLAEEASRKNAEAARANAESERISAEAARTNAESQRAQNETARQTADTERALAEENRAKRFETLQKEINTAAATLVSPTVTVMPAENGYQVKVTDNTGEHMFSLMNGKDGAQGIQGPSGKTAYQYAVESGYKYSEDQFKQDSNPENIKAAATPKKGVDYFDGIPGKDYILTNDDKNEIADLVLAAIGGQPVFGYVDGSNNIIITAPLDNGTYTAKYEMDDGSTMLIGNLVLGAVAYPLITNFTNCYFKHTTHSSSTVEHGNTFSASLVANNGYMISSIKVTMNNMDITASVVSGTDIYISGVTGDIVITAVATETSSNNMVRTSIDENGNIFNSIGYKNNYYASSSGFKDSEGSGYVVTGLMPNILKNTSDSLYIKGATLTTSDTKIRFITFSDALALHGLINGDLWSSRITIETLGTNYYKLTPTSGYISSGNADKPYFRISLLGSGENLVISTEPIQ